MALVNSEIKLECILCLALDMMMVNVLFIHLIENCQISCTVVDCSVTLIV